MKTIAKDQRICGSKIQTGGRILSNPILDENISPQTAISIILYKINHNWDHWLGLGYSTPTHVLRAMAESFGIDFHSPDPVQS